MKLNFQTLVDACCTPDEPRLRACMARNMSLNRRNGAGQPLWELAPGAPGEPARVARFLGVMFEHNLRLDMSNLKGKTLLDAPHDQGREDVALVMMQAPKGWGHIARRREKHTPLPEGRKAWLDTLLAKGQAMRIDQACGRAMGKRSGARP